MPDLFSTGLSGLSVARAALVTTAHNTANVHTEGFSRQKVLIASNLAQQTGAGSMGNGAGVRSVARSYDRFLSAQLAQAESSAHGLETYATQVSRLDNLLADQASGLSALMQEFFAGVQGVADTPADPAARQQLVSSANALAGKFRSVDAYLVDLNRSVNEQIEGSVRQINAIATQVANLNGKISQLSAGGQPPNDLLDTRDQLVKDLGKLVGVTVVEQEGAQYNLFVGHGHTLVLGNRVAMAGAVASAADPTRSAVALIRAGGEPTELAEGGISGGSLGGLLAFRAQALNATQNAVGRMAAVLASAFNAQHRSGTDLAGASGSDFFSLSGPQVYADDGNAGGAAGITLRAQVTNASQLSASDYAIKVGGTVLAPSYSVVRLSDGQQVPVTLDDGSAAASFTGFPVTFDGVRVAVDVAGSVAPGDSFLVLPTRHAARDLAVAVGDPARIAAAAAPVATTTTSATAAISPATADASYRAAPFDGAVSLQFVAGKLLVTPATLPVRVTQADGTTASFAAGVAVPYSDGAAITLGGITVTLSGLPADGDTFVLQPQPSGVSDGRNALALAALQRQTLVGDGAATLNGAYAGLVSEVGNRTMEVQVAYSSQSSLAAQVRASQQAVSGVNQDEETANLLMFQQMYQANAKVIQAASAMFDTILGLR
jgi:flagellar hook-associated protein 1